MLNYRNTNIIFLVLFALLLVLSFFVMVDWYWFLVLFGFRFSILLVGSFWIQFNFHVNAYCSNSLETQKKIALTFDDGPSENTLLILDLLKKNGVKATFFCVGKNIETHQKIFKRIIAEGHIIGNHSYSHSHFFDFYGKKQVITEIEKTDNLIVSILGKKPTLFRPPYGVTNPAIRKALFDTKHKTVGWNIRSLDGVIKNEKLIFNRIIKRLSPGGIVLLHDTSKQTINVLEQFLLFLQNNNYTVVSLEQLLNIEAYES